MFFSARFQNLPCNIKYVTFQTNVLSLTWEQNNIPLFYKCFLKSFFQNCSILIFHFFITAQSFALGSLAYLESSETWIKYDFWENSFSRFRNLVVKNTLKMLENVLNMPLARVQMYKPSIQLNFSFLVSFSVFFSFKFLQFVFSLERYIFERLMRFVFSSLYLNAIFDKLVHTK